MDLDASLVEHLGLAILALALLAKEAFLAARQRNGTQVGGRVLERLGALEALAARLETLLVAQDRRIEKLPPDWLKDQVRDMRHEIQVLTERVHQLQRPREGPT